MPLIPPKREDIATLFPSGKDRELQRLVTYLESIQQADFDATSSIGDIEDAISDIENLLVAQFSNVTRAEKIEMDRRMDDLENLIIGQNLNPFRADAIGALTLSTGTNQNIPSGAAYTKVDVFDVTDNLGPISVDATNDWFIIPVTGVYFITYTVSIAVVANSTLVETIVQRDTTQVSQSYQRLTFRNSNDENTLTNSFYTRAIGNEQITLNIRHDQGAAQNFPFEAAQMTIELRNIGD